MIINLSDASDLILEQAAVILFEGAKSVTIKNWTTLESCREEVRDCLKEGFLCLGFIRKEELAGWIGARPLYGNYTWEIHPLMVHPHHQGTGIGTDLLYYAEKEIYDRGGRNLFAGTDDELEQTSLSGKDLYNGRIFEELQNLKNLKCHPFEFYRKNGFSLVGAVPDAAGKGKPDILLAKPLTI